MPDHVSTEADKNRAGDSMAQVTTPKITPSMPFEAMSQTQDIRATFCQRVLGSHVRLRAQGVVSVEAEEVSQTILVDR